MGQKIDRTYLFERMPVGQAVRRQIIPSIASQMVILLYNLADTYFVGLLNDAAQTAAVSLAYSVTLLMTALANLFAVGGAGRIAQLLAAVASAADDAAGSVRDHAADRHLAVLRRLARKVKGEGHIFFIRHGEASGIKTAHRTAVRLNVIFQRSPVTPSKAQPQAGLRGRG